MSSSWAPSARSAWRRAGLLVRKAHLWTDEGEDGPEGFTGHRSHHSVGGEALRGLKGLPLGLDRAGFADGAPAGDGRG